MQLLDRFLVIKGIGLPKAMKILHLKRPQVFPILDRYVVKLLTNIDPGQRNKAALSRLAISALNLSRKDILENADNFAILRERLADLPIQLTTTRLYDILCWSHWKWNHLDDRKATRWENVGSRYIPMRSIIPVENFMAEIT